MSLYGIDISKWQSKGTATKGKDFVIIKATEGNNYVDPMCNTHWKEAGNKLKGLYHFARPDRNRGAAGARAEASFFVKNIKNYVGKAVLVLDYECAPYSDDWAYAFAEQVHKETGVWPMFYASASKVNSYNWAKTAANCGLWIAGYPKKYNVQNPPTPTEKDMPYRIGKWKFWAIWQYTSSAGALDRDIANLTKAQWEKYAKAGSSPAPAPKPKKDDFLPAKGYWKSSTTSRGGDTAPQIGAMANFMLKTFPAYTPKAAKGTYFGPNLRKSIIRFQKNTNLQADGNVGPITYNKLKTYGFTDWKKWK